MIYSYPVSPVHFKFHSSIQIYTVQVLGEISGFCIINISLIGVTSCSKVWAFKGSKIEHLYSGLSTVHTFEPNISLIRLTLVMQNPSWLNSYSAVNGLFHTKA